MTKQSFERIPAKRGTKYRSSLESRLAKSLTNRKAKFEYETVKLPYIINHNYVPDFILDNGIMIEAKGFLTPDDRRKLKAVKEQHPDIDLRIVFQRASNKLSKNSRTTYAMWATSAGFLWAEGVIPTKWIKEATPT